MLLLLNLFAQELPVQLFYWENANLVARRWLERVLPHSGPAGR